MQFYTEETWVIGIPKMRNSETFELRLKSLIRKRDSQIGHNPSHPGLLAMPMEAKIEEKNYVKRFKFIELRI